MMPWWPTSRRWVFYSFALSWTRKCAGFPPLSHSLLKVGRRAGVRLLEWQEEAAGCSPVHGLLALPALPALPSSSRLGGTQGSCQPFTPPLLAGCPHLPQEERRAAAVREGGLVTYKQQMSFGVHVLAMMAAFYAFGHVAGMAITGNRAVVRAAPQPHGCCAARLCLTCNCIESLQRAVGAGGRGR